MPDPRPQQARSREIVAQETRPVPRRLRGQADPSREANNRAWPLALAVRAVPVLPIYVVDPPDLKRRQPVPTLTPLGPARLAKALTPPRPPLRLRLHPSSMARILLKPFEGTGRGDQMVNGRFAPSIGWRSTVPATQQPVTDSRASLSSCPEMGTAFIMEWRENCV